jgi:hypothetical protein
MSELREWTERQAWALFWTRLALVALFLLLLCLVYSSRISQWRRSWLQVR